MQILYAITLCAKTQLVSGMLHKIKLVASDQVDAVRLAKRKAEALNLEVLRVEELEVLKQTAVPLFANAVREEN